MSKLPCEVVEDLLPMYAEQLTRSVTNEMMEEHLRDCAACNQKYQRMCTPMEGEAPREEKEIDFLKKTRKRTQKIIILSVGIVWFLAVAFLCARFFFCGSYMNTDYLSYYLEVSGADLTIAVSTTSNQGIQKVDVNEMEGVVEITVRGVPKSLFFDGEETRQFHASQEIRQVWIGNRIIWANGESISPLTANLYDAYNPYVGSMPSNGKLVSILNMTSFTGGFKNELQTKEEPYGWRMIFENDFSRNRKEAFEERLRMYSYVLLAQIGNLEEVIYEYTMDGEKVELSVTSEDATAFAGVDIKTVGEDVNRLEMLVRKTGLSNIVLGGDLVESNGQVDFSFSDDTDRVLQFTVVNYAEDDIYGMQIKVLCDGQEANQSMTERPLRCRESAIRIWSGAQRVG